METTLRGVGVSHGVAIGEVRHMGTAVLEPPAKQIPAEEAEREQGRARQAVEAVAADLIARGNLAGGEAQAVLEAQAMMAQDPELMADVERRIAVGSTAERGVYDAFAAYRALLAGAGEYLAGRVADLDDVRNRIVARLLGVPMPGVPDSDEPYVLIARDLAPADTALLDPALVLGFVTEEGGPTSHSAILARALGVPAVVALPGAGELVEGTVIAVDGSTGEIFVEPGAEKRASLEQAAAARKAALAASSGPGATSDGHKVPLLANVGGPADVPAAVEAGAEGVGLFRTEFLFLDDSKKAPSEEKQVDAYRKVLEAFPEGRVVVRVLDAGADKPLDFLTPGDEPNPALGVRGLRTLLDHPDVLRTQLTALAKAAEGLPVYLEVMAPMVADRTDAKAFADACREAGLRGEVRRDGGDSVRRAAGPLDPAGGGVPVAGHQRPGAVHLRRGPSGGCRLASAGSVAAGAAGPRGGFGRGREGRGQELWCLRRGCLRSAVGVCADRARCHQPVDGCGVDSLRPLDAVEAHAGAVRACGGRGACGGHRRGRAGCRAGGALRGVIPRGAGASQES